MPHCATKSLAMVHGGIFTGPCTFRLYAIPSSLLHSTTTHNKLVPNWLDHQHDTKKMLIISTTWQLSVKDCLLLSNWPFKMCWEGIFFRHVSVSLPQLSIRQGLNTTQHPTQACTTMEIKSSTLVLYHQVPIATIGNNGWHQRKMCISWPAKNHQLLQAKKKMVTRAFWFLHRQYAPWSRGLYFLHR